jgi:hypothetical protein
MATTNTRFLAVAANEPNLGVGWTIRILDYKDMTSLVGFAADFTEFSFTQQLNDVGTGSVTFDEDSPWWSNIFNDSAGNVQSNRIIKDFEFVFEAWQDGVRRFAWLGQTVTNTVIGDDETRAVTISGPGIAQVLTWAPINRPGWPTKIPLTTKFVDDNNGKVTWLPRAISYSDKLPAALWQFPEKWPTMRMWWTVFKSAQRRGLIPFVTPMFTALKDSGRQDWQYIRTVANIVSGDGFQPSSLMEHLLDFLNECTGQDYSTWFGQRLEWIMHPGFKLDVRPRIGIDRSKTVRFFVGNIVSDERTRDREEIYNRVIAVSVNGDEILRQDSASVAKWNLREQRNEADKNIDNVPLLSSVADRLILQTKDEKDEWAIKIPYEESIRKPFVAFGVGDDIGISVDPLGSASGFATYRVMAITISVTSDSRVPDCELTLQSIIDAQAIALQKQITKLINEPAVVAVGKMKDVSQPDSTKNQKSTLVWNPVTKKWEATPITATTSGGGSGSGTMFVQKTDPSTVTGTTVSVGDFWLETYD